MGRVEAHRLVAHGLGVGIARLVRPARFPAALTVLADGRWCQVAACQGSPAAPRRGRTVAQPHADRSCGWAGPAAEVEREDRSAQRLIAGRAAAAGSPSTHGEEDGVGQVVAVGQRHRLRFRRGFGRSGSRARAGLAGRSARRTAGPSSSVSGSVRRDALRGGEQPDDAALGGRGSVSRRANRLRDPQRLQRAGQPQDQRAHAAVRARSATWFAQRP